MLLCRNVCLAGLTSWPIPVVVTWSKSIQKKERLRLENTVQEFIVGCLGILSGARQNSLISTSKGGKSPTHPNAKTKLQPILLLGVLY